MANDNRELRNVFGNFPTGITVVTTVSSEGAPVGMTVNSFSSVSLDPPLILWCLARSSTALPVFENAEFFAVNMLADDQKEVSNRFASSAADKFENLDWEKGKGDAPLLQGCAARLQCKKVAQYDGGDHIILIGEVVAFDDAGKSALVFYRGNYAVTAQPS